MKDPRTVLVTGASAGIGAAIACRLARDGYRVYGTTRLLANLEGAPAELRAAMDEAAASAAPSVPRHALRFVELDVTKDDSVRRCVAQVTEESGQIDVLINNAGWAAYGTVEELPIKTAMDMFDTLVFGALRMMQAVVPAMRQRGDGLVLNISSIAGRAVLPFGSHYSAAKAALESMTMGLRQELRPFGVRVTVLEPSDTKTRSYEQTVFSEAKGSPYEPWSTLVWAYAGDAIAQAPPPAVVANKVASILRKKNPSPIYTCGIPLQRIAPTAFRFFPKRVELRAMRVFYGLGLK